MRDKEKLSRKKLFGYGLAALAVFAYPMDERKFNLLKRALEITKPAESRRWMRN